MRRVLLVCVLLLGACASDSNGGPKAAEEATTTAPIRNTTTTETSTKLPESFPIGTRVETTRGNFFTLHAYEQPVPSRNEFLQPDPGNEFASADVEFCRGAPTDENDFFTSVGPEGFELQMGDNTRRSFGVGIREPTLDSTEVPSVGDCVRGWVTYEVPVGIRPKFLICLQTDPLVKFAL